MKTIKIEPLSLEAYKTYGTYAHMINPNDERIGDGQVEFYRDQLQLDVSPQSLLSYSCCRVEKRPLVLDGLEYHKNCYEVVLPLDNDILLLVAPATPESKPPLDRVRGFFVPKGTAITVKAGVWHGCPFSANDNVANVLINLPERAYSNDCYFTAIEKEEQLLIEM
jgi:ureidoglycolate hydrolase